MWGIGSSAIPVPDLIVRRGQEIFCKLVALLSNGMIAGRHPSMMPIRRIYLHGRRELARQFNSLAAYRYTNHTLGSVFVNAAQMDFRIKCLPRASAALNEQVFSRCCGG